MFAMGTYRFNEATGQPTQYQAQSVPEVLSTAVSSYISIGGVVSNLLKPLILVYLSITAIGLF